MKLSIIIPVLNEAFLIERSLQALQPLRQLGHQVIVIDGGSTDATPALAHALCDKLLQTAAGRAAQMNLGAAQAEADILLFLHADTTLPATAEVLLREVMVDPEIKWGRFDAQINGSRLLRLIALAMNWRSHLTGIATGDQAIFVRRSVFMDAGGFAEIPLMEDVEFSKRLRKLAWPRRISVPVKVSNRRWQAHGIIRTILLMWWLRFLFFVGVEPQRLVSMYYKNSR
ncbi:MAG: TIGR04283 family arsenosugar biosynthesis glycosyltransferase [Pseudohongiellaceae bacterium]